MTYLHDLQDNAKTPASGAMLMPNCGELPRRVCRMCANYREGGICAEASRGTTSALEPADDKRCFTPLDPSAKVEAPEVNDTPVLRERRLKRSERYQSKAAREKREEQANKQPADPTPTTRICVRCGRELPLERFRHQRGQYDRIHTCSDCIAESRFGKRDHKPVEVPPKSAKRVVAPHPHKYATDEERMEARRRVKREYNQRRQAEKRAKDSAAETNNGTRICKVCGRELPLYEFAKTKGGGRRYTCRDCQHEGFVAAGSKSHQKGAVSVKEVAKVEQVQRTIDKARDKALALGPETVAKCLAEAAQAMEGVAKELMK